MTEPRRMFVYFHPSNFDDPKFLGTLTSQFLRGKEMFSFAFDQRFLEENPKQFLDPDLQMYSGFQYTDKANFGLFMDSAPDRWGRRLMLRREAVLARRDGRRTMPLNESDFLLGVDDETRMGALRFKTEADGPFLNNDKSMSAPPWARIRELEEASRNFEASSDPTEHGKWLDMLVKPGSSLGGARPKANVSFTDGSIWIAKFPARNDSSNVAAWEYATMQMAKDVGLRTPPCMLERLSKYGSTFLTKRFDRSGSKRIHFASAMTLLGARDGDDSLDGASYLEIAELIIRSGASPTEDLRELWMRIAFSIAVSNTDDHLRNHGFLLTPLGWRLSPLFDVNPNPLGNGLSLNVSDTDNSLDLSLAVEVAPLFRVTTKDVNEFLAKLASVVSNWRNYATHAHIPHSEQEEMSLAFNHG